ncbi:hypothetical protein A3741_26450, partial [Oleiphilus sp. HI0069]
MRQISLLICCISLITFSSLSLAKPLASKDKINKVSDYFMSQVVQAEYDSAYSLMSAYIGVSPEQFEERGKKISHDMKMLEARQGKPLSFALLKQESVGEHFYKISYLLKYPSAALVWELNYYQPQEGWNLVDISFNTNIN